MKKSASIDTYWHKNSPAFSNQYKSISGIPLTPVGLFLVLRLKKINALLKKLPGKTFVDVGCGSGVFIEEAIRQGRYAIGVDYSSLMIDTAREYLSSYPKKSYTLLCADAAKLPIKPDSVNIILASGLTDYLTTIGVNRFMDEVKRVLKKGGFAIITFPKKDSPLAFLRSGAGLYVRKTILRLPPMETAYTKKEVIDLYKEAKLKPIQFDEVFGTMRIAVGRKL